MSAAIQDIGDRVDATVDELLEFLDSPGGRRFRRYLANGLILSVPLVMRMPWLKRSPIGKLIELGGGAAILMKVAELVRDWERDPSTVRARVIDVTPPRPV